MTYFDNLVSRLNLRRSIYITREPEAVSCILVNTMASCSDATPAFVGDSETFLPIVRFICSSFSYSEPIFVHIDIDAMTVS